MICLTRLNGRAFILNADLIEYIESTPDTLITMMNGNTYMVREAPEVVLDLVIRYRQAVFNNLPKIVTEAAPNDSNS